MGRKYILTSASSDKTLILGEVWNTAFAVEILISSVVNKVDNYKKRMDPLKIGIWLFYNNLSFIQFDYKK